MLDLKQALRRIWRSPLLTITVVLSLGVGIGATTSIFTLVNSLLLPVRGGLSSPNELVDLGRTDQGSGFDTSSYPNFLDFRQRNRVFSDLCAYEFGPGSLGLVGDNSAETVQGQRVSRNFFSVLGVKPGLGGFFPTGSAAAEARVAVLGYRLWQGRFQADPGVVGQSIRLNGEPFTVVGVAEPEFRGLSVFAADLWIPLDALEDPATLGSRRASWLMMTGRLAPGVTLAQAQSAMSVLASNLEEEYPEENQGRGLVLTPSSFLPGPISGVVSAFLGLLAALAGLILVITCVNVTGILLARSSARQSETAIRVALGANRSGLVRMLVVESLAWFVLGGIAAYWISGWILTFLRSLLPPLPLPLNLDLTVGVRVALFCAAVSVLAGILTGLLPALRATRSELTDSLRATYAEGRQSLRLRRLLLAGQVALVALLLVSASLFLRSLQNAGEIDPGFRIADLQVFSFDLDQAGYKEAEGQTFAGTLWERAQGLPGVAEAALSRQVPLDGSGFAMGGIYPTARALEATGETHGADWNIVTPGYFRTLEIPVLRGRAFLETDRSGSPDVAIINQTAADRLWGGVDPLGKQFRDSPDGDGRLLTVVGVAHNAKYRSLGEDPRNFIYVPLAQNYNSRLSLFLRTSPNAPNPAPALRSALGEIDANLPIVSARSMRDAAQLGLVPQRLAVFVAASLGTVGLLLAVLGIYGVADHSVQRRTREIGVRSALGAQRRTLLRMILRQEMLPVAAGLITGLAGGAAATTLVEGLLYNISGADPTSFLGTTLVLLGTAILACYFPARRALTLNLAAILREE